MKTPLLFTIFAAFTMARLHAATSTGDPPLKYVKDVAAKAINTLGIELLAKTGRPDANALLSPYSIQSALAMTYAGAAGKTQEEMMTVLHFPKETAALNASFAALAKGLMNPKETITLTVANRLYGQQGYDFRKPFLAVTRESYGAPLAQVDFKKAADKATKLINDWVAQTTHDRITGLIPDGALTKTTRLVLVNAIYLKAAWEVEFQEANTRPGSFYVNQNDAHDVPMMNKQASYGYAKKEGYTAMAIPYTGSDLQFVVLLPDSPNGLAALEAKLTPEMLADCAKLESAEVNLSMPKLKMEPPAMALGDALKALGMQTAFDVPQGSANFDGIAPHKPGDYLYIAEVFHKTFLSLDEHGTEAAAATAVMAEGGAKAAPQSPNEVHVDHPFLFAIQDRGSGACLFLGRVIDPK